MSGIKVLKASREDWMKGAKTSSKGQMIDFVFTEELESKRQPIGSDKYCKSA